MESTDKNKTSLKAKPAKALADFERVKKDYLDKKEQAITALEVYNMYLGAGFNDFTMDRYFNRFISHVKSLFYQISPMMLKWEQYAGVLSTWEVLRNYEEYITKADWILFFERLNTFMYDVGITGIEMAQLALESKDDEEV